MTELSSRVERREMYLGKLEAAHIKLAKKTLEAVREEIERRGKGKGKGSGRSTPPSRERKDRDVERGAAPTELTTAAVPEDKDGSKQSEGEEEEYEDDEVFDEEKEQARMEVLVNELGPFVEEFYPEIKPASRLKRASDAPANLFKTWRANRSHGHGVADGYGRVGREGSDESGGGGGTTYPPTGLPNGRRDGTSKKNPTFIPPTNGGSGCKKTIWHALHALPRSYLDPYQPLVSLHTLFRGATAPAIDYYHSKVGFLTGLIQESRTVAQRDLRPTSTAFVTFHSPEDARRCVRYVSFYPPV
jgi:hypothetical protein